MTQNEIHDISIKSPNIDDIDSHTDSLDFDTSTDTEMGEVSSAIEEVTPILDKQQKMNGKKIMSVKKSKRAKKSIEPERKDSTDSNISQLEEIRKARPTPCQELEWRKALPSLEKKAIKAAVL